VILLLDTDVLLDVVLDRHPHVEHSAALLDHLTKQPGSSFIAWHTLANVFYLTRKGSTGMSAIDFFRALLEFVRVAPTTTNDALRSIDLGLSDMEDALQVAAAQACGAQYIITRNTRHYRRSPIPAITPGEYLNRATP
jgi:predicted nucleic acid-binding protein